MLIYQRVAARGFTLLEVLVAIAVIAILGAVVVPSTIGASEAKRILDTATDLVAIKKANGLYAATGVKAQLGRISFASIQPVTADTTSCNGLQPVGGTMVVVYTGSQGTGWTGPYMSRANSRQGGFVTGIGVMNDIMVRTTANNILGSLIITIPSVRLEDAKGLNDYMDGDASNANLSNTLGSIQYTVPTTGLIVDLTYRFAMVTKEC